VKYVPHDYQDVAKQWILDHPAAGLFLDMGLGKTVTTLTAIEELKNDYLDIQKVLVIAPKRVAEDTWPDEHQKWDHLKDSLRLVKIMGTQKERLNALKQPGDVYIITRDNVAWLVDTLRRNWDFDTVVIDELSSFKSNQSLRFKKLKLVRPFIKRIIGLTGTPAPNSYMDLWSQIYLLDRGERLGKTITEYRRNYFDTLPRPGYNEYRLKPGAKEKIDQLISDICISMKARDYLNQEEPLYIDRIVKLSDKEYKLYKTMERDAVLEFGEDDYITALSAATVTNKLLQLANGAIYDEAKNYRVIHDKKLDALEELLEEAGEESVLVYYSYISDKERILQRFKNARVLEREKDIRDWNAGKIPVMVAHPASAGHGLNLQDGGSIIIWFGLPWSLELYMQANARLWRQGQKNVVRIYHLLAEGTVDFRVLNVLKGKNIRQEELIASLKAEIRGESKCPIRSQTA
jgi:SNF2 family DNA or RNA helicase